MIGAWRADAGRGGDVTLVWGLPLVRGAVAATAELEGEVVDQTPVQEGRFTLVAVDAVKGFGDDLFLEVRLWDRRLNEIAAESLYDEDDEAEAERGRGLARAARRPRPRRASASSIGTISRPNGHSETGISLKLPSPSGIPMIVMQSTDSGHEMADREPPAGEHEPDHVADQRRRAGVGPLDARCGRTATARRRQLQRLEPERDRDDEDEHHHRRRAGSRVRAGCRRRVSQMMLSTP